MIPSVNININKFLKLYGFGEKNLLIKRSKSHLPKDELVGIDNFPIRFKLNLNLGEEPWSTG